MSLVGSDIKICKTKSLGFSEDERRNWEEKFKTFKGNVFGDPSSFKHLHAINIEQCMSRSYGNSHPNHSQTRC